MCAHRVLWTYTFLIHPLLTDFKTQSTSLCYGFTIKSMYWDLPVTKSSVTHLTVTEQFRAESKLGSAKWYQSQVRTLRNVFKLYLVGV